MLFESADAKIRPVFRSENAEVFHGDAIKVLEAIPDDTFDLIFADPPYRLSNGGVSVQNGKQVSVDKGAWDKSDGVESDHDFNMSWLGECRRVLKPNGTIWVSGTYHSIYSCGFAIQKLGFRILNEISWFKPNASPNLGRRMFTASHETLIWAAKSTKSKHVYNYELMRQENNPGERFKNPGKQMRSVWEVELGEDVWTLPTTPIREKQHGRHPTQKPLSLLDRIIRATTKVGDLVLDPFLGSGTTAEAALKLGRRIVGIDSSLEYLNDIAIPRIKSEVGPGSEMKK